MGAKSFRSNKGLGGNWQKQRSLIFLNGMLYHQDAPEFGENTDQSVVLVTLRKEVVKLFDAFHFSMLQV